MVECYRIQRNVWRTRSEIFDAGGKVVYRTRSRGSRVDLFVPGDDRPRYTIRLKSFWRQSLVLMDAQVDAPIASFVPKNNTGTWHVYDPAEALMGTVRPMQPPREVVQQFKPLVAGNLGAMLKAAKGQLKDVVEVAKQYGLRREYVVHDRPAIEFESVPRAHETQVRVLDRSAKGVTSILAIAIGLSCVPPIPSYDWIAEE